MVKLRLVFVLDRPYKITEWLARGFSQEDARGRLWTAALETFAREFGLEYDTACKDVSRAYYGASCKPGMAAKAFTKRFEGKAVRLDAIVPGTTEALDAIIPPKSKAKPSPKPRSGSTRAKPEASGAERSRSRDSSLRLGQRSMLRPSTSRNSLRHMNSCWTSARQVDISLGVSRKSAHWSPNPPRTYVVNGTAGKGFVLHCSGATNGCSDLDRLQMLKGYLEAGLVKVEDLQNPDYGGGPISARVYHENGRSRSRSDLRVVDSEGRGVDMAILHAAIVAQPGRFDFALLNQLCGTQVGSDVSAEQLAAFVEAGRVTVDHLVKCWGGAPTSHDDAYTAKLETLALKRKSGSILGREFDNALAALAAEFGVNKKTIEADYRNIEARASVPLLPGMLSPEDASLVRPMRDYVRDFAILNTGGKGVVMSLHEPDLSKALMPRDDFEFLHRNEWIETISADGKINTVYPAKEFLRKPPKATQVYHGGLVFKPSGTVAADEYNLYRGMLIEPDESGSCELFKKLIRDVWVQGDDTAYQWVLEWFMHIIAHPGAKVSTSIAIRGEYGDGKSIVTEKLMRTILGDMLLRVANQKLILGDFNEAAIGKLLITLEEAAFAGDKAAFDRLKEQITGDKVVINPKFKAPVVVDNYARMLIVSNHAHFLHLKPGDRRYVVLEILAELEGHEQVPSAAGGMGQRWSGAFRI